MASVFSSPPNIPKGTAVADGFRVAPDFSTLAVTGVDSKGQVLSNSSYKNYGPGMEVTPLTTWNIVPYPLTTFNIVAATEVPAKGWLTLTGDNGATTLVASNNPNMFPPGAPNTAYIQLDWPRVPVVGVDDDIGAPVNVTFFGYDWYGVPLQHTYTINGEGAYGATINYAPLSPVPPFPATPTINGKAFYKITGVYFNGATPSGVNVGCITSNTFGLPYVLKSTNDVSTFSWNGFDMMDQTGIAQFQAGGSITISTPAATALNRLAQVTLNGANNFQAGIGLGFSTGVAGAAGDPGNQGTVYIDGINLATPLSGANFVLDSTDPDDDSKPSWTIKGGGTALIQVADIGIASPSSAPISTAFTGDVRGLFQLPTLNETWGLSPDGTRRAIFTYYCEGFDQWLNILNAGGQPQLSGVPGPVNPSNTIVPPNVIADMYGVPQYYTGVPA